MARIPLRKEYKRIPLKREVINRTLQQADKVEVGKVIIAGDEQRFIIEYLKDFNGTKAAIRAGYPERSAHNYAHNFLKKASVIAAIQTELADRRQEARIEISEVIRYWWAMATADVREFTPIQWRCCRYCWGEDNLYQFTSNEWRETRIKHQKMFKHLKDEDRPVLDALGGIGYNQMRDPMRGPEWENKGFSVNADHSCPECNGKGLARIEQVDLSKLSYGAQLIFEGIKVSANGDVEFKLTSNRSRGMEQVALLLGFVKQRRTIKEINFGEMEADELDAVLAEAESRGYLHPSDYKGKTIDIAVD
jgi:phage terminase small subunit